MFAMSGGTFAHSLLGLSFGAELTVRLKGRGCQVTGSDLRVRTGERGLSTYRDVSLVCGEAKFAEYRLIPTLKEYVLVSQSEPGIETFLRPLNGEGVMTGFMGLDSVCILRSPDNSIPPGEIYAGVPASA